MCKDNIQEMNVYDLFEGNWRHDNCTRDNILLLFLSDRKKEIIRQEKEYTAFNGIKYKGIDTNDAPVKILIDQASRDGNDIDTILCIVSRQVYERRLDKNDKNYPGDSNTDYETFNKLVHDTYNDVKKYHTSIKEPVIIPVPYDFKVLEDKTFIDIDIEKRQLAVYERLTKLIKKNSTVYMDYTGGLRDMNFMLAMLLQYMELQGIKCSGIVYSAFNDKKVIDLRNVYDFNRIITGTNEYVHTGRAEQLLSFYKEKEQIMSTNALTKIIDIIESLQNFSNMISVCNVSQMDEERIRLQMALNEAKTIRDSEDINISLFKRMFDDIRQGMHLDNSNNNEFTYPMIIQWCLDRNLLQQAITIYIEKMPEYYFQKNRNNKFIPDRYLSDILYLDNSEKPAEVFYTKLYNKILDSGRLPFETRRIEFQNMLKTIVAKSGFGNSRRSNSEVYEIFNFIEWDRFPKEKQSLETHIHSIYDSEGNKIEKQLNEPGTVARFFNKYSNEIDWYYDIVDKEHKDEWEKSYKTKKDTHFKKIQACKILDASDDSSEYFVKVIRTYALLKIARNYMAHASEELERVSDEDKKTIYDYFAQFSIDTNQLRDFNYIKEIIQDGINLEYDN